MKNLLKHLSIDSSEKRDSFVVGAALMGVLTHFITKDMYFSFVILFIGAWILNLLAPNT